MAMTLAKAHEDAHSDEEIVETELTIKCKCGHVFSFPMPTDSEKSSQELVEEGVRRFYQTHIHTE